MSKKPKETRYYQAIVSRPWFCEGQGYREWLYHEPLKIGPPRTSSKRCSTDITEYKEKMYKDGGPWKGALTEARAKGHPEPVFKVKQIWPVPLADQVVI